MNNLLNINSWKDLILHKKISEEDRELFLKGLQEHPEWVNQEDQNQKTALMYV